MVTFLKVAGDDTAQLLYKLYYEQEQTSIGRMSTSLDLAFNDGMLDDVEREWKLVMGNQVDSEFMRFEERAGMNDEDDDE
jgi:hypothetical protein